MLSSSLLRVEALPSPLLNGLIEDPVHLPSLNLERTYHNLLSHEERSGSPKESPKASVNLNRRLRRTALDFAQPVKVPMPLLRPREMDTQRGEKDEDLESRKCTESTMHDCFVSHEKERVVERRAEGAPDGTDPRSETGSGKKISLNDFIEKALGRVDEAADDWLRVRRERSMRIRRR
jgi:hypothetical protein